MQPLSVPQEIPQHSTKKFGCFWFVVAPIVLLLVPVFMLLVVFPWLSQDAFISVDQLNPSEIDSIRIQLLNHPYRKDDVDPVYIDLDDFQAALDPLKSQVVVDAMPTSAHLGEYRIRLKNGGRGTIRMRWQQEPTGCGEALAAVVGPTPAEIGMVPPMYRLYYQIGPKIYRTETNVLELFPRIAEMTIRGKSAR